MLAGVGTVPGRTGLRKCACCAVPCCAGSAQLPITFQVCMAQGRLLQAWDTRSSDRLPWAASHCCVLTGVPAGHRAQQQPTRHLPRMDRWCRQGQTQAELPPCHCICTAPVPSNKGTPLTGCDVQAQRVPLLVAAPTLLAAGAPGGEPPPHPGAGSAGGSCRAAAGQLPAGHQQGQRHLAAGAQAGERCCPCAEQS
jgi:hypothetical protein